jgi:pantetheine-phosphate adenylyltransferase
MKTAIYAGSFDPITNGHLWMIEKASVIFDRLVVAVGVNPEKKCMFTEKERMEMMEEVAIGVAYTLDFSIDRIMVTSFGSQYLVDYASQRAIKYLVRGIRNESDYEYERGMRHINQDLKPNIDTVFLMPPREISEISSSMVKGLIGPKGWEEVVRKYVPDPVYEKILKKVNN